LHFGRRKEVISKHFISIWFFIGALLTVYGLLILGTGLYEVATHASLAVVMPHLHINVWWGAGMLLLGLLYLVRFWPSRRTSGDAGR
jgi:hypothetical protein